MFRENLSTGSTFLRLGVYEMPTEEELEQRVTEQIDSLEGAKRAILIEIDKNKKAVDESENIPRL